MRENFEMFMDYFTGPNVLEILLVLLLFGIGYIFVRLHLDRDSKFDLEDLICHEGKLEERKLARFGAWFISTWGFLYLLVSNPEKFPEWYFMGYMGVWAANAILDKWINKGGYGQNNNNNYYQPPQSTKFPSPPQPRDPVRD